MSTNYLMEKEVQEAISAGERALSCLQEAAKELAKARNWGMVDIFGGGLLISIIKHAKINNASSRMDAARNALRVFEKELKDVVMYQELHMEIGDFLTFADFFFDNFLVGQPGGFHGAVENNGSGQTSGSGNWEGGTAAAAAA